MKTALPLFRILVEQLPEKVDRVSSALTGDYEQRRGLPAARAISTIVEAGLQSASDSLLDGIGRMSSFTLTPEQWGEIAEHCRGVLRETYEAMMGKVKPLADELGVTELVLHECEQMLAVKVGEIDARIATGRVRAPSIRKPALRDAIKVLAGLLLGVLAGQLVVM